MKVPFTFIKRHSNLPVYQQQNYNFNIMIGTIYGMHILNIISGSNPVKQVGSCKFIMVHQLKEGLATYCSNPKSSDKNSLENCLTEACEAGEDVYNAVNMQ